MGSLFAKLLGNMSGNLGDTVSKIASIWKVPADVVMQNQTEILRIQNETAQKVLESTNAEIQAAAEVIKAEANSQSWIPRNVRPLLLLIWGCTISINALVGMYAHYFHDASIVPMPLDPWVYKLTAIGFTGYVTARTWEKVSDKDN